jgi:hypothetical protein
MPQNPADEPSADRVTSRDAAETAVQQAVAEWMRTAADPELTEDRALALLKRSDVTGDVLEQLAKNNSVIKSRKVKVALVSHAHTPRQVSVPMARQFYTFELMKISLSPAVPADIKLAVEDILISRLKAVTLGERRTLARRASGRIAAALLVDGEDGDGKRKADDSGGADDRKRRKAKSPGQQAGIMQTALQNPRLTESLVIKAILRPSADVELVATVARHDKWSKRREIRVALLRTEHLSLGSALEFASEIPFSLLAKTLANSRLPAKIKNHLLRKMEQ